MLLDPPPPPKRLPGAPQPPRLGTRLGGDPTFPPAALPVLQQVTWAALRAVAAARAPPGGAAAAARAPPEDSGDAAAAEDDEEEEKDGRQRPSRYLRHAVVKAWERVGDRACKSLFDASADGGSGDAWVRWHAACAGVALAVARLPRLSAHPQSTLERRRGQLLRKLLCYLGLSLLVVTPPHLERLTAPPAERGRPAPRDAAAPLLELRWALAAELVAQRVAVQRHAALEAGGAEPAAEGEAAANAAEAVAEGEGEAQLATQPAEAEAVLHPAEVACLAALALGVCQPGWELRLRRGGKVVEVEAAARDGQGGGGDAWRVATVPRALRAPLASAVRGVRGLQDKTHKDVGVEERVWSWVSQALRAVPGVIWDEVEAQLVGNS